jgi:ribonuclease HII
LTATAPLSRVEFICSYRRFWLKEKAMRRGQMPLSDEFNRPLEFIDIEEQGYSRGFTCIAGLDEVGRGPLAGPVIAAAVVLPRGFTHPEIKDSKLLTADQRETIAPVIREKAACWAVGIVEVEEIDRINILNASLLAMVKAFRALKPPPDCLLIDGRETIPPGWFKTGKKPASSLPQQRTIIKGDQLCLSIAAASILAKVARDAIMVESDKKYPDYGFASHKGYSSAAHLELLRRLGPSPIHRKSFAPVRAARPEDIEWMVGSLFEKL